MKVWIDLTKVETVEEAQKHCDAANAMLNKLGVKGEYFWATDEQRYTSTFYNANEDGSGAGGYTELSDRGKWFNLGYLAYGKADA